MHIVATMPAMAIVPIVAVMSVMAIVVRQVVMVRVHHVRRRGGVVGKGWPVVRPMMWRVVVRRRKMMRRAMVRRRMVRVWWWVMRSAVRRMPAVVRWRETWLVLVIDHKG